jgi:hypothetical protein
MTAVPTREISAELIAKGASDEETGRRFGLSSSAVRRRRRCWGIAARRKSRCRPPAEQSADVLHRQRGDLSDWQIAELYAGRRYNMAAAPPGPGRRR